MVDRWEASLIIKYTNRRTIGRAFRPNTLWACGSVLLALLLMSFGSGAYAHRSGKLQVVAHDMIHTIKTASRLTRQLAVTPNTISIDIGHKEYQKLCYLQQRALNEGSLITRDDSYVPATIRYADQTIKVQLRLKGDEIRHVTSKKWSFRVKVKGNNAFMGMKKFSLHSAHERAFASEWLFHHMAQRDDLIGLRYDFAQIDLNGESLGIYAIEEHFEKRLIENTHRREGPILSFDENSWWDEHHALYDNDLRAMWTYDWFRQTPGYGGYHALQITPFQPKRTYTNEHLHAQYEIARALLEGFREGQLQTSQVFDVNHVARYLALCDLFAGNHSLHTNQLRFYYNPVISKLELIPFDPGIVEGQKLTMPISTIPDHAQHVNRLFSKDFDNRWGYNQANFLDQLFSDFAFYEAYNRELHRLSHKTYLDEMLAHFQEELDRHTKVIQTEYTDYHFSSDALYANARYIQMLLHPNKAIHAFLSELKGHQASIELGALQIMPVRVIGLNFHGQQIVTTKDNVILPPKSYRNPVTYRTIQFDLPSSIDLSKDVLSHITVNYQILGIDTVQSQPLFLESRMGDSRVAKDIFRRSSNISEFPFVELDSNNNSIIIEPGSWTIDHDLILPAGYTVIGRPDTRLNLINQAMILSHSSLDLEGTEKHPFIIESSDQTGQGILVMSGDSPSTLRHVQFHSLSNPASGGWSVTSAITFYETTVSLKNCLFIANRCEDALNVVRGEFHLDSCRFEKTLSDAFDSDFSKGSITNSEFSECGNDAIDVSGTAIQVENIRIYKAGDKGISAGENSRVLARNITIRNSKIGVASKDLSNVTIEQLTIDNCNYSFAAYQKKSEFGPATIEANGITVKNVLQPSLVEQNSSLYIDGAAIDDNHENVYQTLEPQGY